jgi:His-Xaa-Ser system protein HxsD
VSDLTTTLGPDRVEADVDLGVYPREAVYAAAFTFIDRCYVRLALQDGGRLGVVLRAKSAGSLDMEALAGELREELSGQAWRVRLAEQGRDLMASITAGAYGGTSHDGGELGA